MEGQLQLRREDHEHGREFTKMQDLPLESSPHLKCTDLENYKIMIGYVPPSARAYQICLDGGVMAAATTADGGHASPREIAAIEKKIK